MKPQPPNSPGNAPKEKPPYLKVLPYDKLTFEEEDRLQKYVAPLRTHKVIVEKAIRYVVKKLENKAPMYWNRDGLDGYLKSLFRDYRPENRDLRNHITKHIRKFFKVTYGTSIEHAQPPTKEQIAAGESSLNYQYWVSQDTGKIQKNITTRAMAAIKTLHNGVEILEDPGVTFISNNDRTRLINEAGAPVLAAVALLCRSIEKACARDIITPEQLDRATKRPSDDVLPYPSMKNVSSQDLVKFTAAYLHNVPKPKQNPPTNPVSKKSGGTP